MPLSRRCLASARGAARSGWRPLALAAALLASAAIASAEDAGSFPEPADAADALPSATTLDRITWSRSPGSTRFEFVGRHLADPAVRQPIPTRLVVDLRAAATGVVPERFDLDTPEIKTMRRLPDVPGLLPEGVSQRWFVELARDGLGWSVVERADGFTLFVGDADKAGNRDVTFDDTSWYADLTAEATALQEEPPLATERLPRSLAIRVAADQEVRRSPSPLSVDMGHAATGQTRLVDARRGDWVHLVGGGWIRQDLGGPSEAPAPTDSPSARSAAQWTVITLGTGLTIDVRELVPGAEGDAAALLAKLAEPVRFAQLNVRVSGDAAFQLQLPPKRGRLSAVMKDGTTVESLDPREIPLRNPRDRDEVDAAFASPVVTAGEGLRAFLPMPKGFDFLAVTDLHIEIAGQLHRLFRIPGSGEPADAAR
jgi:hypothetical protein